VQKSKWGLPLTSGVSKLENVMEWEYFFTNLVLWNGILGKATGRSGADQKGLENAGMPNINTINRN